MDVDICHYRGGHATYAELIIGGQEHTVWDNLEKHRQHMLSVCTRAESTYLTVARFPEIINI